MTVDDLTPDQRNEVQEYYVRAYFARKRRAAFNAVPVTRYDHTGRPLGEPLPSRPRVSQDDRPLGSASGFYRRGRARGGPNAGNR